MGFNRFPKFAALESEGWVRVGAVPRLTGLWVMRRGSKEAGERWTQSERLGSWWCRRLPMS